MWKLSKIEKHPDKYEWRETLSAEFDTFDNAKLFAKNFCGVGADVWEHEQDEEVGEYWMVEDGLITYEIIEG